ncbi:glycoside hydrolase family 31 protein [Myriangium duriaei CBS 260.36]|uniref:alpha-glucosidase n=1 Tax=Myriangium duriaei CBS 260.36 TaxID=1168546 RepID=A0A9P4J607_9PEZI|nr:glycoside hydrolase family 31 protein [Myriangium duriaei CBS 260.36]
MVSAWYKGFGPIVLGTLAAQGVLAQSATPTATVATATVDGNTITYSPQFTVPASVDQSANLIPNVDDPQAVNAQTVCPGYQASNVQRTAYGFNATLTLCDKPCNVYGTDIEELVLTVDYQTADRLNVNIKPAHITSENQTQYILSPELVELPQHGEPTDDSDETDLQFSWTNEPTFSFTVLRKSTGEVLFSTAGTKLVYEDQFIEFVNVLPENYNLYGLGEHFHALRLGNNYTATFFAADAGNPLDFNLYGSHPFFLDTRYYEVDNKTGEYTLVTGNVSAGNDYISRSHGVYLRNAHPLEAVLNTTSLTWRALGGSIDLYFYAGDSQPKVTSQYVQSIGLPAMHQYFTLGYHQCRWGYKNWTMLRDVVTNFKNYQIPLETVWTDIDYMFQYRDFTNDPNTFSYPEGQEFLAELHANGQHYIPIVDAAIYIPNPNNASDNYSVYDRGHAVNAFLKNPDGSEYIGDVWPGYTVFPDWLNSNTTPWWVENLQGHHENIPWDGIWIDMSEASSFCIGSCGSQNRSINPVHPPFSLPGEPGAIEYVYPENFNVTNATEAASVSAASASDPANAPTPTAAVSTTTTSYLRTTVTPGVRQIEYPPYVIKNVNGELGTHAISPNATHVDGTQEYDVHNLNGHRILNATYAGVAASIEGKRPFIIGRSTFAGSGKFAGHWGGDNNSRWGSMFFSISQALSFSLFGIPMFGVDTCGFSGNTDNELCSRWMALSAFFSFYRNHNVLSAISQEPYVWEDVATATRAAMNIRYQLLPYMYTLLFKAHISGSTFLRALSWEFPNDPTLAVVETQFLLGPAILVTPVLEPGVTTVNGVFPGLNEGARWYDWYNQSAVTAAPFVNTTLDAPLTHIPVHIRGGYILPLQEAKMTTTESRNSSWSLIVPLDQNQAATGDIYIDDGASQVQNATLEVALTASNGTLYASSKGEYKDTNALANVTVLGMVKAPTSVALNGNTVQFSYDNAIGRLSVTGLQNTTAQGAWSQDWRLTWA